MSVYIGKYVTEHYSYDTQPGNKVGLFYNAPEHTLGNFFTEMWQYNRMLAVRLSCIGFNVLLKTI